MHLWLFACTETEMPEGEPPAPEPAEQVVDEPVTIEQAIEDMAACSASPGDGRLKLKRACAEPVCLFMETDEAVGALGQPDLLEPISVGEGYDYLQVYWDEGLSAWLEDQDDDGQPDEGSLVLGLSAFAPYDGTTDEGAGIGSEFSCFLDVSPLVELWFTDAGEGLVPYRLETEDFSLYDDDRDGRVDEISFF